MAVLFTPFFQPQDVNGIPLAGAKLAFYAVGTTTPIAVYMDSDGLTPHANPVVADASGIFPPIYVSETSYKTVLKTAADVTVQTVDPVNPFGLGDIPAASDTDAGLVRLATVVEAEAGAAADVAVTPAGMKAAVTGQETIFIPAAALTPNPAAAPSLGVLTATDVCVSYLAFDPSSTEIAHFSIQMPKSWNGGSLVCQAVWTHPSTTTNFGVVFKVNVRAVRNDDALGASYSNTVSMTDTGGTTSDVYVTPESSALTPDGTFGSECMLAGRIYRDPAEGADTMAVDAYLLGVKIHYTTNAMTDD